MSPARSSILIFKHFVGYSICQHKMCRTFSNFWYQIYLLILCDWSPPFISISCLFISVSSICKFSFSTSCISLSSCSSSFSLCCMEVLSLFFQNYKNKVFQCCLIIKLVNVLQTIFYRSISYSTPCKKIIANKHETINSPLCCF